jgi:hypothetical protein
MLYDRKKMKVDAVKIGQPMSLNGRNGQPGDYFVTYADGSMSIVSASVFESNFVPSHMTEVTTITPDSEPEKTPEPKPSGYICIGCGSDTIQSHMFDRNTGMCADCLKKQATCHTCGTTVSQFEIIGTYCRRCLSKPA